MNDVGYRWSFIPAAWNKEGRGIVKNAGMDMARPEKHLLFIGKNCTAWTEQVVGRLFGVPKAIRNLQGNEFQFTVSGGRTVSARFLPGNQFAGAAVWHTRRLPPSSRFTCRFLLLPENPFPFLRSSGWNRPDICGISGSGGSSESLDRREIPLFFSLFPFFRCFFVEKCHETCIFRKCRYGNRFLH